MRFVRPFAVAAFVLVMAVTPLSAFTSGGAFEVWVGGVYNRPVVRVTLQDHTGLVREFARAQLDGPSGISNPQGNHRVLLISVSGGCGDYSVELDFRRTEHGYLVEQRNHSFGCSFLALLGHGTVALTLWSPLDASSVRLESPFSPEAWPERPLRPTPFP